MNDVRSNRILKTFCVLSALTALVVSIFPATLWASDQNIQDNLLKAVQQIQQRCEGRSEFSYSENPFSIFKLTQALDQDLRTKACDTACLEKIIVQMNLLDECLQRRQVQAFEHHVLNQAGRSSRVDLYERSGFSLDYQQNLALSTMNRWRLGVVTEARGSAQIRLNLAQKLAHSSQLIPLRLALKEITTAGSEAPQLIEEWLKLAPYFYFKFDPVFIRYQFDQLAKDAKKISSPTVRLEVFAIFMDLIVEQGVIFSSQFSEVFERYQDPRFWSEWNPRDLGLDEDPLTMIQRADVDDLRKSYHHRQKIAPTSLDRVFEKLRVALEKENGIDRAALRLAIQNKKITFKDPLSHRSYRLGSTPLHEGSILLVLGDGITGFSPLSGLGLPAFGNHVSMIGFMVNDGIRVPFVLDWQLGLMPPSTYFEGGESLVAGSPKSPVLAGSVLRGLNFVLEKQALFDMRAHTDVKNSKDQFSFYCAELMVRILAGEFERPLNEFSLPIPLLAPNWENLTSEVRSNLRSLGLDQIEFFVPAAFLTSSHRIEKIITSPRNPRGDIIFEMWIPLLFRDLNDRVIRALRTREFQSQGGIQGNESSSVLSGLRKAMPYIRGTQLSYRFGLEALAYLDLADDRTFNFLSFIQFYYSEHDRIRGFVRSQLMHNLTEGEMRSHLQRLGEEIETSIGRIFKPLPPSEPL